MSIQHLAQGATQTWDTVFNWDTVAPWSGANAVAHRVVCCHIQYSMFTDAAQTQTREVWNSPAGKVIKVLDAWWKSDQTWDNGKGGTISVGLGANNVAILDAINDSDTGDEWFGILNVAKGTLLASPSSPLIEDSKTGLTVTVDAGAGEVCADMTKGKSWLYLEILEFT